ncbi:hypothetical protein M9Y10_030986 [Tritrichomonas musculus]|uniref:Uncharacterized protein n=1 Tax=Tritrichomonas musculus TaxID=1915356 RepID=A0ABR2H1I4_9EUKA
MRFFRSFIIKTSHKKFLINLCCRKLSEIFNFEKVAFKQNELDTLNYISLSLTKCSDFMQFPKLNYDNKISNHFVEIDTNSLNTIIKQPMHQKFIISTKNREYRCNIFGILSSVILRDLLVSNQTPNRYEYDFEDKFNEFQQICDLFNFKIVKISVEDFQIEDAYQAIDQSLDEFDRFNDEIDKQQIVIDSIEDLFNWLYDIQSLTIQKVALSIEKSNWIKTEDDVKELAAIILQLIGSDIYLHSYLADLLIELDKKSIFNNMLNILMPFIIQKLNEFLRSDLSYCSFIYNLFKRKAITEKKLSEMIRNNNINDNVVSWF